MFLHLVLIYLEVPQNILEHASETDAPKTSKSSDTLDDTTEEYVEPSNVQDGFENQKECDYTSPDTDSDLEEVLIQSDKKNTHFKISLLILN